MGGSNDAIIRNRERVLKDIFDFYSRQTLQNQKSVTFDEINKDFHTINPVKLVRFTIDFNIPVPKLAVTQIFKRVAPGSQSLTFDQFKETIEKLFIEVNQTRLKEIKKKLRDPAKWGWTLDQVSDA